MKDDHYDCYQSHSLVYILFFLSGLLESKDNFRKNYNWIEHVAPITLRYSQVKMNPIKKYIQISERNGYKQGVV